MCLPSLCPTVATMSCLALPVPSDVRASTCDPEPPALRPMSSGYWATCTSGNAPPPPKSAIERGTHPLRLPWGGTALNWGAGAGASGSAAGGACFGSGSTRDPRESSGAVDARLGDVQKYTQGGGKQRTLMPRFQLSIFARNPAGPSNARCVQHGAFSIRLGLLWVRERDAQRVQRRGRAVAGMLWRSITSIRRLVKKVPHVEGTLFTLLALLL
eukprot:scaffold65492_cov31-Phaeocystis_antarctica.AAC.1